jgi:membrane protein DedA with SNARE-associated domain
LSEFVAAHGVWLVAAFIALETVGLPFPAEAALMAAAIFAAKTHGFSIWSLIAAGIAAAVLGNIAGFWIGRTLGHRFFVKHGKRVGLTEERLRIGQWLFARYGGSFVFVARFLPFVRNMAAILAGANSMPSRTFYLASSGAAVIWVVGYGLGCYAFGEAFSDLASPAAIVLCIVAVAILVGVPALILRYEKRLLEKSEHELPHPPRHPAA